MCLYGSAFGGRAKPTRHVISFHYIFFFCQVILEREIERKCVKRHQKFVYTILMSDAVQIIKKGLMDLS